MNVPYQFFIALRYFKAKKRHKGISINTFQGVKYSSPFIFGQVMLSFGERAFGVIVRGIKPEQETDTTDILKYLKDGSVKGLKKDNSGVPGIIIGRELARNLGLLIGDEVRMISPTGE